MTHRNRSRLVGTIASAMLGGTCVAAATAAPAVGAVVGTSPPGDVTCAGAPAGLDLLITTPTQVATQTGEVIAEQDASGVGVPLERAVRGPDGTVWLEAADTSDPALRHSTILRLRDGTTDTVATGEFDLYSTGWLDGQTAATLIDRTLPTSPNVSHYGSVLVDFADGGHVDVGPSADLDFLVFTATLGAGRIVESTTAGYFSHRIASVDGGGNAYADWATPDFEDVADTPILDWPVAATNTSAPEATTLTWLEMRSSPDPVAVLLVSDPVTGGSNEITLGDLDGFLVEQESGGISGRPAHVDFDGRFWVATFESSVGNERRSFVVDTTADEPTATALDCPDGAIVTIDHLGDPEPVVALPSCAQYDLTGGEYPIQFCHKGWDVMEVQIQLAQRGYQVTADGFFGAETGRAVRAFQADNGRKVDGLVGPMTWAALFTGDPAGEDYDGNGTIEPWEVRPSGDAFDADVPAPPATG